MKTKKVAVVLSADEYARVRTMAGLVPLSTWFRNLAIGIRESAPPPNVETFTVLDRRVEQVAGEPAEVVDIPAEESPEKTCPVCGAVIYEIEENTYVNENGTTHICRRKRGK
jgi:hypothetical protein